MNKIVCIFLFGLSLFLPLSVFGQDINPTFYQLTVDEGLSQNSINSITQDSKGFIWICTQDGLNRYDGYEFKIFRHEPGNDNSLSNNYVWSLYEDSDGIFWICTFGGGLTRFDPATEKFKHFKNNAGDSTSISNDFTFQVVEFPEGTLWVATDGGLNSLDKKSGKFQRFTQTTNSARKLENNHIASLTFQGKDKLWFLSDLGLSQINVNTKELKHFTNDPFKNEVFLGSINFILKERNNLILLSEKGVMKLDFVNNKTEMLLENAGVSKSSTQINFQTIIPDRRGYYWIGTNDGLLLFEKSTGRLFSYVNEVTGNSISNNNIISLFQSIDNTIWIGTRNGLNKVYRLKSDFKVFKDDPENKNSLSSKNVSQVLKDSRGLIWIGSTEGVNVMNDQGDEVIVFKNNTGDDNSISSNYILSLSEDKSGDIWVGTRTGGVNLIKVLNENFPPKIQVKRYSKTSGLSSNTIQFICEDRNGIFWIGTGGGGLNKLDPLTGKIKVYRENKDGSGPGHPYVFNIFEDSFNNLWIGTATGGINLFDPVKEKFIYLKNNTSNPNSISNDIILSIYEDKNHNLWIGTAGGLNKLLIPLEKNLFDYFEENVDMWNDSLFRQYGRADGFPNDVIYGILEDDHGFLWLSTNKGIVKFNPNASDPVAKIFDISDGLQNNEFNQNSYFKDENGWMYFGGVGGLNIFHPDSIKQNKFIPPVYFTNFKLFNESVLINQNDKSKIFQLEKSITYTCSLNLEYWHDVISFDFAALNFIQPGKNRYAYMLEGFDEDWIFAGDKRSVTYTNLDPGDYNLLVKASNNAGLWNEMPASIKIYIPPPPWLSWYAYLFYIIIFSGGVFLFIRYRIKAAKHELETQAKIEKAKLEEREEVRRKSSADFHDEAGNKLTKISLFTQLAKSVSEENPSVVEYLEKIEENTKEISSGMRDFIWVLDPEKDSLTDTINRLKDFGYSMFGYTDTNFVVKGLTEDVSKINLSMECRRSILLIFKEAINNCMKYSEAKNVEFEVRLNKNHLELILTDDGKGFDFDKKSDGYGFNNMNQRAVKAGGNISINSEPGKGTKIVFNLNITQMGN